MKDLYDSGFAFSPIHRRLQSELVLSESRVALQKAQYYPDISLNYRRDLGSTNAGEHSDEFLLSATFDSGNGFSKFSTTRAREREVDEAYEKIKVFRREFRRILGDKVANINNLKSLLPPLKVAQEGTLSVVESYVRQFQAGKKSWLDVLNAQRERNQAQIDYLVSKVELDKSRVDLLLYTGGLQAANLMEENHTGKQDDGG